MEGYGRRREASLRALAEKEISVTRMGQGTIQSSSEANRENSQNLNIRIRQQRF